jgi:hypothetical protein
MNIVSKDQVTAVYSGRQGCCCGCRGNHSNSPRSISIAVNKINKVASGDIVGTLDISASYVAADIGDRVVIAYLDGR